MGAINFTLGPGASAVLPGSVIVEADDDAVIVSELPEPTTLALAGSACLASASCAAANGPDEALPLGGARGSVQITSHGRQN